MTPPKVSILMSVYNGEDFLREAIDSILGQTYRDFEFCIIDDGSTDGTASILASYSDSDPRVRVHRQENTGLRRALNNAISLSRGEYLARQDADDRSMPRRMEMQVRLLDEHPDTVLVGTHYHLIDGKGAILNGIRPPTQSEELKKGLVSGNQFAHGSVMYRRSVAEAVGRYREEFVCSEDYDFMLRMSEQGEVANIPEFLYQWRLSLECESVSRRQSQDLYASLAADMAKERREKGFDRLQQMPPNERNRWVQEYLDARRGTVVVDDALGYNKWAKILLDWGNDREAFRFIFRSLALRPLRVDTWRLLCRAGLQVLRS